MEPLDHLTPGDVLAQADLATYVGALGLSVAEAQRALDDNTIRMLGEFTKPIDGLAGKSLLQLGLTPAFYHFRSATLSCSVSMALHVREDIDVNLHVGVGSSSSHTSHVTQGSKSITSKSQSVALSSQKHVTASDTSSAMRAIDSFSSSNSSTSESFALAERTAVSAASSLSATNLVRYSQDAALFVVPPKGEHWAVVQIGHDAAAGETFAVTSAYTTPASTPGEDLAKAIRAGAGVTCLIFSADDANDLGEVRFDNNSYVVQTVGGIDYAARLRALAQIIVAAGLSGLQVIGHTDGVGPTAYNQRLSELRAKAVLDVLLANGVAAGKATTSGAGETGAADNVADPARRFTEIKPPAGFNHWLLYLEGAPLLAGPIVSSATANGFLLAGAYDGDGKASGGALVHTSAELAADLNTRSTLEASQVGELVYLTNKTGESANFAKVTVYAKDDTGFASDETTDLDEKTETSAETSTAETSDSTTNRATAVAVSLDARYARMYDLTMSGNLSIAAELVSIPPPPEFLKFIQDHLGD